MKNGVRNPMRLSKRGTTLVELIVALSLTAIFAVVCIALINPIERVYKQTERVARAQLLADTIVDGIRKECDNAKNDDINSVWIADGNINNDSGLFDEDCSLRKTEGHILVFKKNNSYCEAIFSELKITEQNKTDANNNSLEGTLSGHAVDDLFEGDKENTEKGIVHFGYYQAGDKGKGVYPLKSYDYTNPVLASTYGDFYVKIYFKNLVTRDVTIDSVTHTIPSFVECEVRVYEGDYIESDADAAKNLVYTRTAALCFSANGSAPGSSYQKPDKEKTSKEVTVFVIWDDNNNFRNQRPEKVNIVLNYGSKSISHELATNKNPNSIKFVNIDASSYSVALKTIDGKDTVDGYETPRIVWNSDKTEVVITIKQNSVKLVSGPAFNKMLNSDVAGVVFCSNDEALANGWIESSDTYKLASIPSDATNDNNRTEDYKLYTKGTMVYVTSSDGSFVANENSEQMFKGHSELTAVSNLNSIDTSNVYTMYRMFMDCKKLTQVDVSDWNTENVVAFDGMFRNVCCDASLDPEVKMIIDLRSFSFVSCKNLSGGLNTDKSVTGINKMFYTDAGLTSRIDTIIFPSDSEKKNMYQLERLQQVFYGCDNLVNLLNFNDLNLSNVSDGSDYKGIMGLFDHCANLKSVDLSNWNLSNPGCKDLSVFFASSSNPGIQDLDMHGFKIPQCESISSFFSKLGSLKTVNLSGSDFSNIKSFEKLFENKSKLTDANFYNCKASSISSVAFMFHNCSNLKSVDMKGVVGSSCTSMESVFEGCKNLNDMDISGWNTINITNMANSFKLCHTNTGDSFEIDLHEFKFGKVTDMSGMFNGSNTTKIVFPGNPNFSNVNDIAGMFQNCKELIIIEGFNNVSFPLIKDASHLFGGCSSLTSVDFDMELSSALNIDYMFSNCTSLGTVNLTMDYPEATSAKGLFYNCSSLSNAKLDMDFDDVTDITSMFYGCESLTTINLDLYAPKVTSIEGLFSGCKKLTTLGFNAELGSVENVSYLFNDCAKLQKADLELDFANVKHADYLFNGCSSLESISISKLNMPNVETLDNLFSGCSSLTSMTLSWDLASVTTIKNMFKDCTALKSVDIKLTVPSVENVSGLFDGCSNLENVKLDLESGSITDINSLFKNLGSLEEVKGKFNTPVVSKVNYLFNNCSALKSVDISNSVFTGCTDAQKFYYNCPLLESITMNDVVLSSCTNFNDMFSNCTNLKHVTLQRIDIQKATSLTFMARSTITTLDLSGANLSGVTSLSTWANNMKNLQEISFNGADLGACTTMHQMFNGRTTLTKADFAGANVPECTSTNQMFNGCTNLTTVNMEGFSTPKNQSCYQMFYNCYNVTTINLGGWDTSNVTTMFRMFCNCAYDPNHTVTQASVVIDISSFDFSKVTTFEEMFNCDKTKNDKVVRIILPAGDKAVDKANSVNAKRMFRQRRNLLYIDNIGDFTIQNSIADITSLFAASGVKIVDISGIDLSKVASGKANWMFNNCSNLERIYVKQGTVYNNLAIKQNTVFQYETNNGYTTPPLMGGNNTAWSSDHITGEYARVDDPDNGKPGYFTEKTA